jgi:hypothetical protein
MIAWYAETAAQQPSPGHDWDWELARLLGLGAAQASWMNQNREEGNSKRICCLWALERKIIAVEPELLSIAELNTMLQVPIIDLRVHNHALLPPIAQQIVATKRLFSNVIMVRLTSLRSLRSIHWCGGGGGGGAAQAPRADPACRLPPMRGRSVCVPALLCGEMYCTKMFRRLRAFVIRKRSQSFCAVPTSAPPRDSGKRLPPVSFYR